MGTGVVSRTLAGFPKLAGCGRWLASAGPAQGFLLSAGPPCGRMVQPTSLQPQARVVPPTFCRHGVAQPPKTPCCSPPLASPLPALTVVRPWETQVPVSLLWSTPCALEPSSSGCHMASVAVPKARPPHSGNTRNYGLREVKTLAQHLLRASLPPTLQDCLLCSRVLDHLLKV